jgi:predicted nucleic acid-binding protein
MSYLLDSSAWLAHLFGEPGVEQINLLFEDSRFDVSISVLSIPEVHSRLKALGQQAQWAEVWKLYASLFSRVLPVDEGIAQQALLLRNAIPHRLPTIDCLIAATAAAQQVTLVHRDPHFMMIPERYLKQLQLPDK